MRTMLNSLIVVTGMSAAFVAGFWTRDQICFYKDLAKYEHNENINRRPYNTYSDLNNSMKKEYDKGYKTGYTVGWKDCREADEEEEPKL